MRSARALPLVAMCMVIVSATFAANKPVNLEDPVELLDAYIRAVGDTSGKPSMSYGNGTVYAYVPGEKPRALFGLQVVGVGRFTRLEGGGYQRLHREIGFYTDLKSGAILSSWFNPYTQREVEVIAIQNDPVNRKFLPDGGATYKYLRSGDEISFYREVPLRYLNPIDPTNYPQYSSGEWYEAIEMFNNFVSASDLANRKLTSIVSNGSWTRMGPWLPWMEMGRHQGHLLYHSRSLKVSDGAAGLPAALREHIARTAPKYLQAPEKLVTPDETSWTFFKKVLDERKKHAPTK
jgi:hypothetical protein